MTVDPGSARSARSRTSARSWRGTLLAAVGLLTSDPPPTFRLPDYADCLAGFVEARLVPTLTCSACRLAEPWPCSCSGAILRYRGRSSWPGPTPGGRGRSRPVRSRASGPARCRHGAATRGVEFRATYQGCSRRRPRRNGPGGDIAHGRCAPARANEAMLLAMAEADLRGVPAPRQRASPLLCGERDLRSPVDVGRALHKAIPGSSLVLLPGVRHLSNVEAADRFNREVRSFLEQNRD